MADGDDDDEENHNLAQKRNFDHAVYKELSLTNGKINKMMKDEIKQSLAGFGLDTRGVKEVLKKRLKTHIKKEKLAKAKVEEEWKRNSLDYYCVIDFEGTCEEDACQDYIHEIIEFPAVLVNASTLEVEDEFHHYCKPTSKPELSEFCIALTGITQDTVNRALCFTEVLDRFYQWLQKHELGNKYKFAVVTDGPWDITRFLSMQCELSDIPMPVFARRWINLRKHYRNFYGVQGNIQNMLQNLEMEFEGRPHSGMDDSRNITRILMKMIEDGCDLVFNEWLNKRNSCNRRAKVL